MVPGLLLFSNVGSNFAWWQLKQKVARCSAPQVTAPHWTAPARPPDLWLRPWTKMCFPTTGSVPWRTFPIRSTSPSTWPWWEFWEWWVRTPAFSFAWWSEPCCSDHLRHVSLAGCHIPNPDNAYMASSGRFSLIKHLATSNPVYLTLASILGAASAGGIHLWFLIPIFLCLLQQWNIEGLSWDVQECGTEKVSVLRENIWVPDVHIAEL